MDDANRGANATVTVDLEKQEIRGPDGGVVKFEIDPFRKHCLLEGLDNIGLTLEKREGDRRVRGKGADRAALALEPRREPCATGGRRWRNRST